MGNAPETLREQNRRELLVSTRWPLSVEPGPVKLFNVRLREWDSAVAPEAELDSWLRAYNSALAVDLPADPAWEIWMLRDYLTVTMPGERRLTWIAEDDSATGEVLGYCRLLMLDGLGVIELYVVPSARRSGLGSALLETLAHRAVAEGFASLGVEVMGDAAADFYTRHGFNHVYTEMRSLLDLTIVDWDHVTEMADAVVPGYRLEFHRDQLPAQIMPSYAEAKQVRRLDPTGDLTLRPSSYDVERLEASLTCLRARGLKPYIVVAIHERTERVAALTELVVPAQHPTRADQYDTTVVPEHNSYGLARAVKARMLVELRTTDPQLRDVQTWHAADRAQLQQVNKELGFKPDRKWREYEADALNVIKRIG